MKNTWYIFFKPHKRSDTGGSVIQQIHPKNEPEFWIGEKSPDQSWENLCPKCDTIVSKGAFQIQVCIDRVTYMLEPVPRPICPRCKSTVYGAIALFESPAEASAYQTLRLRNYRIDRYIEVHQPVDAPASVYAN